MSSKSQKYLKNAAELEYFDKFKGAFSKCTFNFSLNSLEKNIYKGFAAFLKFYLNKDDYIYILILNKYSQKPCKTSFFFD